MRDIKFRGQIVDSKEWVYGNLIIRNEPKEHGLSEVGYNEEGEVIFIDVYYIYNEDDDRALTDNFIKVIPETVGQYTGLKDKNGKEIYEGDIVKGEPVRYQCECFDKCDCRKIKIYNIGVICWNDSELRWDILSKFGKYPQQASKVNIFINYGIEVIGNIHQNPELLEE